MCFERSRLAIVGKQTSQGSGLVYYGSQFTFEAGLLACRELDDTLGLDALNEEESA